VTQDKLVNDGFELATYSSVASLAVVLCGHAGNGKTHFGLTAPGGIAYFNLDKGLKGVLQKFVNDKKIYLHNINMPKPETGVMFSEDKHGKAKAVTYQIVKEEFVDQARKCWDQVVHLSRTAYNSKNIKSIVYDTESAMWELIRLARFGKTTQVEPYQYGPVNLEYSGLVEELCGSGKNVIFLDRMKKTYMHEKWTGKYERGGFGSLGYLADVSGQIVYNEKEGMWYIDINDKCRIDPAFMGVRLPNDDYPLPVDFPNLAVSLVEGTEYEDWE